MLAFDPVAGMIVASRPSNNHLMPGYGLMKVTMYIISYYIIGSLYITCLLQLFEIFQIIISVTDWDGLF